MKSKDALIDEILKLPGVNPLRSVPLRNYAFKLSLDDQHASWDFHDSSHALLAGLQITERQVPQQLWRAVFPVSPK